MIRKIDNENIMIILASILCIVILVIINYSLLLSAPKNLNETTQPNQIEEIEITYERFGAKGDGTTNDIEAIRAAHDYANELYVKTGVLPTVYSCDSIDCSDKTYYIGSSNGNGDIKVITNVDWRNANFIIDDYIDANRDGNNDVNPSEYLFTVTTPMRLFGKLNSGNSELVHYNEEIIQKLSKAKSINPNTTNLKILIDSLYTGEINTTRLNNNYYKKHREDLENYFKSSKRWVIMVKDSTRKYIRKGSNINTGNNQTDIIIIDSTTGEVLSDINWTYDDIIELKVYPVPEKQISIGNGKFTTYTYNTAYDNNGKISMNSNRNIYISYSANVKLQNIDHYLNEEIHSYNSNYQTASNGNMYYGFIRVNNSAYVDAINIYLSPHTPVNMVSNRKITTMFNGTYDLIIENSANIFLNNINYACNIYNEDGTKNDSKCYKDNIINAKKWGIMGSNSSKNVFIKNSKLNRIDAHRGITNLYIADTIVGTSSGKGSLTLTGQGYFYAENLKLDNTNHAISFRDDFGSTWNGTMVFNGLHVAINEGSSYPVIFKSNNDETWYFGYDTYFPNIYINDLRLDIDSRNATKVKYITLIDLSKLTSSSEKDNLYKFKGNFYLNGITYGKTDKNDSNYTPSVPIVNLFSYSFINSSGNPLNRYNYGGSNLVNLYLDKDVVVDKKVTSYSSSKFKKVNSMEDKTQEVSSYFTELEKKSKMP